MRCSTISKLPSLRSQIVLDLVAHAPRLGLGVVDQLAGPRLGFAHDLGALDHAGRAHARQLEDLVAFAADLGQELLALLQQPPGGPQLVGETIEDLVEQLEHFVLVDARIGRQRDRTGGFDDFDRPPQQYSALGAWYGDGFSRRGSPCSDIEFTLRRGTCHAVV